MENSVRVERIKSIPTYDAAFDHLTNFYKRRKISHDRDIDEVVDLTGDDPSQEDRSEVIEEDKVEEDGGDDTIQRASGVPCMSICQCTKMTS